MPCYAQIPVRQHGSLCYRHTDISTRRHRVAAYCQAQATAGSQQNGTGGQHLPDVTADNAQCSNAYVEMYVASIGKTPTTRRVPPRPKAPASVQQAAVQQPPQQQRSPDLSQQRALKTELASLASQMQTRGTQLSQAEAALRQRDNEIASLRLMLSERDEKINSTMTELAEVHEQLRCQESSLQQAYNQLADASRDKARVRQQLLENQTELTGIHSQIAQWSQDLFQLKSIMDTLEEEEHLEAYEPMLLSGTQPSFTDGQPGPNDLLSVTAELNQKTEAALAGTEGPKDGLSLLEDIASLSKQMVGEAQEDVELFRRASSKSTD